MEYLSIKKVKSNPNNPRTITDDNFDKLVKSIKEFPRMLELRPLVVDENMIVLGGNMRLKACKEAGLKKIPVISADDLTDEQKKEFIIKDNVGFGDWNYEDLNTTEWESEKLAEWGLDIPMDVKIDSMEDGEELEFEQSVQLIPPMEYIMIMAEPNSEEWEEVKELLKLKMVRRGGYKKGSAFDAVSLERVLNWKDFKKRYVNSSTKQK